jgi:ParB-like chromosome segregation protein Spo0J
MSPADMNGVTWGFERESVVVPVASILPLKPLRPDVKMSSKYRQIVTSIKAVGLVEPPVVIPDRDNPGGYFLLDGHLRLEALKDLDVQTVDCLVSRDDEGLPR